MAFLRLVGLKVLHTWGNETTFAELINRKGRTSPAMDLGFGFFFQVGWALVVFLWAWRAFRDLAGRAPVGALEVVVAVIVLSNALVYCVYEGGARHHLPMVPLLLLYALRQRD